MIDRHTVSPSIFLSLSMIYSPLTDSLGSGKEGIECENTVDDDDGAEQVEAGEKSEEREMLGMMRYLYDHQQDLHLLH